MGFHSLHSRPGALNTSSFQQVAFTYDRTSGIAAIYINGTLITQSDIGKVTPLTEGDIWIGHRPNWPAGTWTYNKFFAGLIDEIAIYNRALSPDEIKQIQ